MDDETLLARAEQALTEIKVETGLSERHAAVLAALRIRLKGSDPGSLDAMLAAADHEAGAPSLDEHLAAAGREAEGKPTLDDLFAEEPEEPDRSS
jgi:hypothetical protein